MKDLRKKRNVKIVKEKETQNVTKRMKTDFQINETSNMKRKLNYYGNKKLDL